MWTILFEYNEKKNIYVPVQSGYNVIPSAEIDKIVPVEKNVARQAEKVYFKDGKLKLRSGEKLLSDAELDENDKVSMEIEEMGIPFPKDDKVKIFKVE